MIATFAFIVTLKCVVAADNIILKGIDVPQYSFAGDQATVSCYYDLKSKRLYSLKWYHNRTEFYRYVPNEPQHPVIYGISHSFEALETSRSLRHVTLLIRHLRPSASGIYRCEVIADFPSFRTEALAGSMTVLRDPLYPPVIVDVREIYEPTDNITIGCQPQSVRNLSPWPSIKWYINGRMVGPEFLSNYGRRLNGEHKGVALSISGEKVEKEGGSVTVECRLNLGSHLRSSSRELRVRMRQVSYVRSISSGFYSENSWRLLLVFSFFVKKIRVIFSL